MARQGKKIKVIEKKLGREKAYGQAWQGEGTIEIDPRQANKEYLDTLIHEALHLVFPDESEKKVTSAAHEISQVVWAQGYGRISK